MDQGQDVWEDGRALSLDGHVEPVVASQRAQEVLLECLTSGLRALGREREFSKRL